MGPRSSAQQHPATPHDRCSPAIGVVLTLLLSAVFWLGLIWAAIRLYG